MFIVNSFDLQENDSQSFGSTLIKPNLICSKLFVE